MLKTPISSEFQWALLGVSKHANNIRIIKIKPQN